MKETFDAPLWRPEQKKKAIHQRRIFDRCAHELVLYNVPVQDEPWQCNKCLAWFPGQAYARREVQKECRWEPMFYGPLPGDTDFTIDYRRAEAARAR